MPLICVVFHLIPKQHFRYLCHLASKGTVKPVISTCVPLKTVASVQRAIELGETAYGVCICRPWADREDVASSAKINRNSEKHPPTES